MKTTVSRFTVVIVIALFGLLPALPHKCQGQSTVFSYQGRLTGGGNPANGSYELRFSLFDAGSGGNQVGNALTNAPVAVSKGLFTVTLDFGTNAFTGAPRWLEIGVRTNGGGVFRILPRQFVTSEPYSLFAARAGTVDWANVSGKPAVGTVTTINTGTGLTGGPITSSGTIFVDNTVVPQLGVANTFSAGPQTVLSGGSPNKGLVVRGAAGQTANLEEWQDSAGNAIASVTAAGIFTGNGGGLTNISGASLTNLDASNISSGTLADARLSANVPLLNRNQTFTGSNAFSGVSSLTNAANNFAGGFSGNGAGLTGLNAANVSAGTLADVRLSGNVALLNANQTFAGSNTFNGVSSFGNTTNRFVGAFIGNGAGLSNVVSTATNFTGSLAGDVTGPMTTTTVARIRGVNVSASQPVANQHLRFDGVSWASAAVALTSDVSGTLGVANGGSGATSASGARANLGAAASGVNADITALAGLTTPLSATQGGNGQSSYTIGDLLYASAATSLSKLPDVAIGSALLSGGVGAAPAWGKIGLTTHVTGTLSIANGGSGAAAATAARANLGAAASGVNSDITSLAGLTTPLSATRGGSGQSSYTVGDLLYASTSTSLSKLPDVVAGNVLLSGGVGAAPTWGKVGLTTHVTGTLPIANGGSGAATATAARANLGAAASGVNSDITSLAGLTSPLPATQGGSGQSNFATGDILFAPAANTLARRAAGSNGQVLAVSANVPVWTNANAHSHHGQSWVGTNFDGLIAQSTATNGTGLHGLANTGSDGYGVYGESFNGFGVVGSGGGYGVYGYSSNGYAIFGQSSGGPFAPQLALFQENTGDSCRLRMGSSGWPQWLIAVSSGATPEMSFNNGSTNVMYVDFVGNLTAKSFNISSDRAVKEEIVNVETREILARVVRLPIQTWSFKDDRATRHMGPMAQDFHAAFNVGPDDKHIATVDADGVALAAIQGLNEVVKEKDARIEALEKRLSQLETLVATLAGKR